MKIKDLTEFIEDGQYMMIEDLNQPFYLGLNYHKNAWILSDDILNRDIKKIAIKDDCLTIIVYPQTNKKHILKNEQDNNNTLEYLCEVLNEICKEE